MPGGRLPRVRCVFVGTRAATPTKTHQTSVGALEALITFLTTSDAGAAYRALVGEAQHATAVRDLLSGSDPIGESAAVVIARALPGEILRVPMPQATAQFVGPVFFWILSGRVSADLDTRRLASEFLNSATSA